MRNHEPTGRTTPLVVRAQAPAPMPSRWRPGTVRLLLLQALLGCAAALLLTVHDLAWDCVSSTYAHSVRFLWNGVYTGAVVVAAWAIVPFWGAVRTGQWRWVVLSLLVTFVTVPLGVAAAIPATRILAPDALVYGSHCGMWPLDWDGPRVVEEFAGPVELIGYHTLVGLVIAMPLTLVASLIGIGGARWDRRRAGGGGRTA